MLMEALQMLKYHYKKMRLDSCRSEKWTSHADLVEDDPDEPDDKGMKQGGNLDINDCVEDLVQKSEVEEGIGLADTIIVYPCIAIQ